MAKFGHVQGTKQEKSGASDWYRQHEAAHLARIEAAEDAARALTTALAIQVGNAASAMPEAAPRIAKAASLVQKKDVWPLSDGTFLVGSETDTELAYLVRRGPWTCDCADHTQRQHLCKHALAAMFTVKLGSQYTPSYQ
jgi:hypothetical protein